MQKQEDWKNTAFIDTHRKDDGLARASPSREGEIDLAK
jgi:hypothetical protein